MGPRLRHVAGWYGGAIAATVIAYLVAVSILNSAMGLGGRGGLLVLIFGGLATYSAYVALMVCTVRLSPHVSLLHRAGGIMLCLLVVPLLMFLTVAAAFPD